MNRRDFDDRVVLVTGAAGGLGTALVERFARAGARIGALDVRRGELDDAVRRWRGDGMTVEPAVADCTDEDAVIGAVAGIAESLGPIHTVINNAGITHIRNFAADLAPAVGRVMDVNFRGAVHVTAACLDQVVAQRGLFVTISSVAGFAPLLGRTGYAASKHALHGFFDSLRLELRDTGTGVLVVCPSFIATGIRRDVDTARGGVGVRDEATPAAVADQVFRAAVRDRQFVAVGRVARLSRLLRRWLPALYDRLMIRSVKSDRTEPE